MEKDYLLDKYNKRYSAYEGKLYFTVFRIGYKFKNNPNASNMTIEGLRGFQRHNNREGKLDNVDSKRTKDNMILIGSKNVEKDVIEYLKGVKLRDNSVIARELVLGAGNGFYERMTKLQQKTWIDNNIKFLKESFGDNCVYATLHLDETTPHLTL